MGARSFRGIYKIPPVTSEAKGVSFPSEGEKRSLFAELIAQSRAKVVLQEPWFTTTRFKTLTVYGTGKFDQQELRRRKLQGECLRRMGLLGYSEL